MVNLAAFEFLYIGSKDHTDTLYGSERTLKLIFELKFGFYNNKATAQFFCQRLDLNMVAKQNS